MKNNLKNLRITLTILFVMVTVLEFGQTKPNVIILATGGTIARAAASETQAGLQSNRD